VAKAKTINLLLNDGTLKGVMSMEDSSWNKGELYSAPRESVDALISSDACSQYGVYLLLSENMVYVGQASDLSKRIKQHIMGKSWWERVVVLTTSDDSLNRSDIDYIEAKLISKATETGRIDCENRTMGNKQKVTKFRKVELDQYLEEALFLLELIGINVFCESEKALDSHRTTSLIPAVKDTPSDQVEIREKREALDFLIENGVTVCKNTNYAKRQRNKDEFWLNPRATALEKDWDIVLNNQFQNEIIVFHIPANTFVMRSGNLQGFVARSDRPEQIDMNIIQDTWIDRRSKYELRDYVVKRIKY